MSNRAQARRAARVQKYDHKAEKKGPNNLAIALLIFIPLALMFVGIWGYQYSKLTKNIETYMQNMGGEAVFESMKIDDETTMSVTAKGNKMSIVVDVKTDDPKAAKKDYVGDEAEENMKTLAAYYLVSMKSNCRGLTANVTYTANVNGKKVNEIKLSYHKAKKLMKDGISG